MAWFTFCKDLSKYHWIKWRRGVGHTVTQERPVHPAMHVPEVAPKCGANFRTAMDTEVLHTLIHYVT